jgi:hypothetical protein
MGMELGLVWLHWSFLHGAYRCIVELTLLNVLNVGFVICSTCLLFYLKIQFPLYNHTLQRNISRLGC